MTIPQLTTSKTGDEEWDILRDGKVIGAVARDSRNKCIYAHLNGYAWTDDGLTSGKGYAFKEFPRKTALGTVRMHLALYLHKAES